MSLLQNAVIWTKPVEIWLINRLLDHAPTGLAILSTDADFQVFYVNPEFTRIFGYVKDDVRSISDWTALA